MGLRISAVSFLSLLSCASSLFGSQPSVPSWVQEVSSRPTPNLPGKVPAAILLSEQRIVVDPSGRITTTTRQAVKILTHEGRREAVAEEYYFNGGRKVTELRAWLVAPNGFVKSYDKNATTDIGAFNEMELYNDIRIRGIKAENPEIGAVFAYESEVEEKPLFAQDSYLFQRNLPAVRSRYILTVPPGWTVHSVVFNHEPIEPVVDGSTYVWELKELPFREQEEHSPSMFGLVPRLAVDFAPPANAPAAVTCFRSWTDVSRWHAQLAANQAEVTPEIVSKVRELIAGTSTEYAKVQAIGRYVQKTKYVAVEMDQAHGGGYKPHAAEEVFHKQYGDCKDKANLMRAMLRSAGIESYLVAISAHDRTFVRQEWPSAEQFNHMILGVRVSDSTDVPTVITAPVGRLLMFDPTSEATPMGDLPGFEQGSYALLMAGDQGGLIKMPVVKPETNLIDLTIQGNLSGAGEFTGSVASIRTGQPADAERGAHLYRTAEQFRTDLERLISHTVKSPAISNLEIQDHFDDNRFSLKLDLSSPGYGQLMQERLLVFGASVLEPPGPTFEHSPNRTEPILLRSGVYRKHVRIKLPRGFALDELPDSVNKDSDFGHFSITYKHDGDDLLMEEELTTEQSTLPASDYQRVKKFFDLFDGADQQKAVLLKAGV